MTNTIKTAEIKKIGEWTLAITPGIYMSEAWKNIPAPTADAPNPDRYLMIDGRVWSWSAVGLDSTGWYVLYIR